MFEAEITYIAETSFAPSGTFCGEMTYDDVYFDSPDGSFYTSGRELRLRRVDGRTLLTHKAPTFDPASRSKEEWETEVESGETLESILTHLGFRRKVAFTKRCRLYRETFRGLELTVTVVRVDFAPQEFVEIEHPAADQPSALAALAVIRDYAAGLGLTRVSHTAYTDRCLAAQAPKMPPKGA